MSCPVTWFEVTGKDAVKLRSFYSDLFGWKIDANNPMNYGMVEAGEGGVGGGIGQGDGAQVTFYVTVADPAATLNKAEAMGGKTTMPVMDVPGGPTIAQFADPEGNVIGIMKPPSM
jgi:predicted enzyme related to lactoylglutathione lyase